MEKFSWIFFQPFEIYPFGICFATVVKKPRLNMYLHFGKFSRTVVIHAVI